MAVVTLQFQTNAGFTLLETLVVVAIIAVMAGIILVSISGNEGNRVRTEAERLQQVMQMAADEAIFQKTEIGMSFTRHSYRFMQYDIVAGNWKDLSTKPFRAYTLPDGMTFDLIENNKQVHLPEMEPKSNAIPSIIFSSSGEMTPYNLALSEPAAVTRALLVADGIAPIVLKTEHAP
jgi:type II secretion system protein H